MFKDFISIVREDLASYRGDWLRPGFQALAFHRFGNWARTIQFKPVRKPLIGASKALFIFARNFYGIELPISVKVGRRVMIEHQGGIVIHGNSVIGDDCTIRQGVTLGIRHMTALSEAPVLGVGVNVGAGAKILGAVTIGDYVNVGANAVVLKSVVAQATVVGIPAEVILVGGVRPQRTSLVELRSALRERN